MRLVYILPHEHLILKSTVFLCGEHGAVSVGEFFPVWDCTAHGSSSEVPSFQDLMPDALRWNRYNNNSNKVGSEWNALKLPQNLPPRPARGNTVSHETSPQCHKGWGPLDGEPTNAKCHCDSETNQPTNNPSKKSPSSNSEGVQRD